VPRSIRSCQLLRLQNRGRQILCVYLYESITSSVIDVQFYYFICRYSIGSCDFIGILGFCVDVFSGYK